MTFHDKIFFHAFPCLSVTVGALIIVSCRWHHFRIELSLRNVVVAERALHIFMTLQTYATTP